MKCLFAKPVFYLHIFVPVLFLSFVITICSPCYSQDEIVFRTLLLSGLSESNQPVSKAPAPLGNAVMKLTIRPEFHNPDENVIESAKDVIRSVYGFSNPMFLTSSYMTWNGKQEYVQEMVCEGHYLYPVRIRPIAISPGAISLRIEGLKFEFYDISYLEERGHLLRVHSSRSYSLLFSEPKRIEESVGYEKWLDQELTLAFHTPVLIRLPEKDSALYLYLQAYRRDNKRIDAGLIGSRLLSYSLGGTDPVCKKKIGQGDGYALGDRPKARLVFEGQAYYFCSEECLNKFKINPEIFLASTPGQIKILKNNKKNQENDIPSRPDVLVVPEYPEAFRQNERDTTINLEFDIDEVGKVRRTRILNPSNATYERIALEAISEWTFRPRLENNQPVPFSIPLDLILNSAVKIDLAARKNQPELPPLSSPLAAQIVNYCAKLESAALYFVCREEIVEKIEPGSQLQNVRATALDPIEKNPHGGMMGGRSVTGERNSFVYDYQIIRKDGRASEKRVLLEENGKPVPDDGAYPKTYRFYINKAIYGPIGLLGRVEQPFYDYSQLKDENVDGRKAYVINIKPKKPSSEKPAYGKAWIDKDDGSILRMSIEAESLAGYERISADYESRGAKPLISIDIVYGFEKNGLRFPSQIVLKEAYKDPKKGKIKISEMTVEYDRYKFFTVGTEWKY